MNKKEIYFRITILVFMAVYAITKLLKLGVYIEVSTAFVMPLILVLYVMRSKKKPIFITLFLIAFSLSETTSLVKHYTVDLSYYLVHISRVLAYASLFVYIISGLKIKELFKRFLLHLIVLLVLGVYLYYKSYSLLNYHGYEFLIYDLIIESSYNLLVILVLIFSFLQYVYHMTKKSVLLFLASLFLCFSELTQFAYYYVKPGLVVNMIYTAFLILGFYFTLQFVSDNQEYQ